MKPILKQPLIENNLHDYIIDAYKDLEEAVDVSYKSPSVSYVSPVNFKESMTTERHRWFPYKEGFSPSFVNNYLSEHLNGLEGNIVDPFCGVGTTPLVAAKHNYKTVGYDVSPLAIFIAKTKALFLDDSELKDLASTIEDFTSSPLKKAAPAPDNQTVISYFEKDYLSCLLQVKSYTSGIPNKKIKDLFSLAFLSIIENCSTHRKAGNGVKRKTKKPEHSHKNAMEHVKAEMTFMLSVYLQDLKQSKKFINPDYFCKSSLEESSLSNLDDIASVVTSPPYANCFDYSKIYMRELWLGDFFTKVQDQKDFRNASMRSHVHATWAERYANFSDNLIDGPVREFLEEQKLWSNKIPDMLSGYFKDIGQLMYLLQPKLLSGARVGFVVGNSFYGGIPIATDLLIAQIGMRLGYTPVRIDVYRGIIPSSQQYTKIEDKYFMRESLVVLEKN